MNRLSQLRRSRGTGVIRFISGICSPTGQVATLTVVCNTSIRSEDLLTKLISKISKAKRVAMSSTVIRSSGSGAFICSLAAVASTFAVDAFPVEIRIDAGQKKGEAQAVWRFFGADEPNYAYMRDGQKLIA